jgi:hypothetical protein
MMRFTIQSDDDLVVLRDSRGWSDRDWLLTGVRGWFGSPEAREGVTKASGHDGDFWPVTMTQGARTSTLSGAILAGSTVGLARELDRLDALVGKRLAVTCEDAHGARMAEGFVSDDPDPEIDGATEQTATFDLVITFPDPHRYGRWSTVTPYGGKARLPNEGNIPSYPRVHVASGDDQTKFTYLAFSSGSQKVTWTGSALSLDIDLADMVPSTGTVGINNAFAVPPGGCVASVSSDGDVTIDVRDAWR